MFEEKTDILKGWSDEGEGTILIIMNPSFPVY
jgi:hypothetical protein